MTTTMTERIPVPYEIVTDKVLALLEGGTVPWHQPWRTNGLPLSMSTGKPYRGVNVFLLNLAGLEGAYESRFWGTYNVIASHGGQVRKGEKSTIVLFWKRGTKVVKDDNGEEKTKSWAMLRYFRVFNADQADWADGLPPRFAPLPMAELDPIAEAETIFDGYFSRDAAPALRLAGDSAFYSPSDDRVTLPQMGRYSKAEEFYSTAFHEATHSTGHKSRLDRPGVQEHRYGGLTTYAKEELIAEMGAAMLCGASGIEQVTLANSAAYLSFWTEAIKGDAKLIVQAAAGAQRAADLILGTEFEEDSNADD